MPRGKGYNRKKQIAKWNKYRKKRGLPAYQAKYRRGIVSIPRPMTYKHKQVLQRVVYHNNFVCDPGLNGTTQQNFMIKMCLNSPWIFEDGWDTYATGTGQTLTPNKTINPVPNTGDPITTTTIMPGLRDGYSQYSAYQRGVVLGTKITLTAAGLQNTQDNSPAVFYVVRHSQPSSGLNAGSTIDDVSNCAFRQMARLTGPIGALTGVAANRNIVGAKLVVRHSPKKFNSVYRSLKTNTSMWFNTTATSPAVGSRPNERDYISIGCVPAYNSLGNQATKFGLQMRVEQLIQFVEPLEDLGGNQNYSLPKPMFSNLNWGAKNFSSFMNR